MTDEAAEGETPAEFETIADPAKLFRVIGMTERLLNELRQGEFGDDARSRVISAYEDSIDELQSVLSDDLRRELDRLVTPLQTDRAPSPGELRIAEAQLSGWLEGLMQGLQASLGQQAAMAQAQAGPQQAEPPRGPELGGYR